MCANQLKFIMISLQIFLKNIFKTIFFLGLIYLTSCGIYKPVDTREVDVNVNKRVQKNIQEGKGFRIFDSRRNQSGTFEFATSNPMWRATIDLLDFTPFSNVDYSGGIIITDWYSGDEMELNESIKITIRFLSNEIRSDGLDISIHKKTCKDQNRCTISKLDSELSNEIKVAILKNAAELEANDIKLDDSPEKKYKSRESILGID